ncbi:MAG TPA: hypothetical protein VKV69_03400 [Actinomycetota bacterium]|nr:hypothetical protein [Actinomycetota bacterium]
MADADAGDGDLRRTLGENISKHVRTVARGKTDARDHFSSELDRAHFRFEGFGSSLEGVTNGDSLIRTGRHSS